MSEHIPGLGCRCSAWSQNECCCDGVDWRSVRIICTDRRGHFPVVGLIDSGPSEFEALGMWDEIGLARAHGSDPNDLIIENTDARHSTGESE